MHRNLSVLIFLAVFTITSTAAGRILMAQSPVASPTPKPPAITQIPVTDYIGESQTEAKPLEALLQTRNINRIFPANIVKYAIRQAVAAGVPADTIVLLLLLPLISFIIAFSRNIVGIRGFGIFLPASLAVVFVAIGPLLGILLFLVIAAVSTLVRIALRRLEIKLQYLPRMSLILWFVTVSVLGILFLAPVIRRSELTGVSIFAVLILTLLVEDFIKVQLGKSVKTAVTLTTETLFLALISYLFFTLKPLQAYALLNPEIFLLSVLLADILMGKYIGLRLMEWWRFRKLINQSA